MIRIRKRAERESSSADATNRCCRNWHVRGKYRESEAGRNQNRMATKQVCIGIEIGGSEMTSGESVRVNHWPPLQLPTAVCKCYARWRSSADTTPRPADRSDRCGSTVRKQNNTFRLKCWSWAIDEQVKCTLYINNRSI